DDDDNPGQVSYESWLGNWTAAREEYDDDGTQWLDTHHTVYDTWEISVKQQGSTYWIMGMENNEYSYDIEDSAVEAVYDPATGALKVSEQVFGQWTYQNYTFTDLLCALFYYAGDASNPAGNYIYNDGALIFTATLSADQKTANLAAEAPLTVL
ncbi:MAG: hypothetical protein J6T89_05155, partial [Bacteroidales bacterium]|nr:hypothetical protein [Bacteroidales bacterium]